MQHQKRKYQNLQFFEKSSEIFLLHFSISIKKNNNIQLVSYILVHQIFYNKSIFNLNQTMELDQPIYVYGFVGNFDVCFILSQDKKNLTIQSIFRMSQNVYENHILPQEIPKQCEALFGDIETLFQYIKQNIRNPGLIQIDDLGQIKIYLIAKTMKKQIKQKCKLAMKQVLDDQKRNAILLNLVRTIRKSVKPNPEVQKQNSKIIELQAQNMKLREQIQKYNSGPYNNNVGPNHDITKVKMVQGFCAPSSKYGQKMHISVRKQSNPFIGYYKVQGDKVIKIKQKNKWVNFFLEQSFPKQGKYYFSFKIIMSLFNNIEVGIVMKQYEMEFGTISEKAISYHLADGIVRHGRKKQEGDQSCKQAPKDKKLIVVTVVDMDQGIISWYCDDQCMGKTKITQYMMLRKIVPFIGMCHVDDIIQLNLE